MITIKVKGKKYEYPTRWDDVKFNTFLRLIDLNLKKIDAIKVILEEIGVELHPGDKIENLESILSASVFLDNTPIIDPNPDKLGEYYFPKNVTFETIEQFQDVCSEIDKVRQSESLQEQSEALAYYAAIYCQGQKEPYDSEKARFLAKTFLELPCLEVLAAGSFFQAKCLSMQSGKTMSFLRQNIQMKKNRQGLKILLKRLASIPLWIRSHGMSMKQTKKSSNGVRESSIQS